MTHHLLAGNFVHCDPGLLRQGPILQFIAAIPEHQSTVEVES